MFSQGHLLWIGISTVLIAGGFLACLHWRPPLNGFLRCCFALGVVSEGVKVLTTSRIVPMVDPVVVGQKIEWTPTGEYTPYLAMEHLPLELCSLYLVFMLLALTVKSGAWKKGLYAVMFASGTIGGVLGITLASIAGDFHSTVEFFAAPRAWQYFLYHSMIVTASLYLGMCEECGLSFRDWKKAILGILFLDIPTFYLNSIFSSEVYSSGRLVGVTHRINFFSSYVNPLGLVLREKWQWIAYLAVRAVLAILFVMLLYLALNILPKVQSKEGRDTTGPRETQPRTEKGSEEARRQ